MKKAAALGKAFLFNLACHYKLRAPPAVAPRRLGGAALGCCTDELRCQHPRTDSVPGLYRKRQTVLLAALLFCAGA